MRSSVWLCSILLAVCYLGGQQHPPDPCAAMKADPYSLGAIKSAMEEFPGSTSWTLKRVWVLGDGASVAVLKTVDPQKLEDPETCRAYLFLVRTAFEYPNGISIEANKDPKVTLFLLGYLKEKEVQNVVLEKEIKSTEAYIKSQSKSAPSVP